MTTTCSGELTLTSFQDTTDNGCTRTITRRYVITDAAGDADTCEQNFIFVFDETRPEFDMYPGDTTVDCRFVPEAAELIPSDNCTMAGGGGQAMIQPWINEFHYDNVGTDVGEFIEIAGLAGDDLTGYSLVLYNGSNGTVYNTMALTGVIDDEGNCMGALSFSYPTNGIQNGSPDGIALVDPMGNVLEFISYEGSFTANGGPADGMMSVDIGVQETSGTPVGESLQKTGTGNMSGAFSWNAPSAESPGSLNVGQMINPAPNCGAGPVVMPWINEFHYDNTGGDVGEFIEIAGLAGDDLTGYQIVLYNGNGGAPYNTRTLGGTFPDEGNCLGALDFQYPSNGIQNGSPDGIALVDPMGNVLEFISYEGAFTAVGGPADGMMSVDIGVSEPGTTPVGFSLQKTGTGNTGTAFAWTGPTNESPGMLNAGQNVSPTLCVSGGLEVVFTESTTPGNCPNEYTITRSWSTEDDCGNDTTWTQVLTVIDTTPPRVATPTNIPDEIIVECGIDPFPMDTVTGYDECDTSPVGTVWINEIHYDNFGVDQMEFVELAGYNGTDLDGWRLVLYNGATQLVYDDMFISGVFTDQTGGFGFITFDYPSNGIQNGSPDGIALVDNNNVVRYFLSYEGTFTAS